MSLQVIQAELKAPKGQTNKFGGYQYRSCEDILEAVKPILAKHEMVLTLSDEVKSVDSVPQMVITDESTKPKKKTLTLGTLSYVEATATITKNGEMVAQVRAQAGIDTNKTGMDVAQCFGASSSYARKYALNGLFCIDDTKDADATNQHGKGEQKERYQNPHENAGSGNEAKAKEFSVRLGDAKSIQEVDSIMVEAEKVWNSWPDAWQNKLNKLAATREKALK
jgi:hypothetical protein